jgi:hypothetical protein
VVRLTASVELRCPETDELVATEQTKPVVYDEDTGVARYHCDACNTGHEYKWGRPSPIYVGDFR